MNEILYADELVLMKYFYIIITMSQVRIGLPLLLPACVPKFKVAHFFICFALEDCRCFLQYH